MTDLFHQLIFSTAERTPDATALVYQTQSLSYASLASEVQGVAYGLNKLGLGRGERVAIYLEKRFETVIAMFATTLAGGVFVPINPVLKPEQVAYILTDCHVRILVTSAERLKLLQRILPICHDLHVAIIADADTSDGFSTTVATWNTVRSNAVANVQSVMDITVIDADMAAIIYTSGSTGKPKGVMLSHRNLIAGAKSVVQYLHNRPDDRILTVLPLSFDYGLSQLTTAFYVGATNVLMNYLLPRDIISAVKEYQITGLAAVPPLWIQLAPLDWHGASSLRYLTNSGGAMPRAALNRLRQALLQTQIYLMYGFTEAFRSTYLVPEQLERRPDSIGKAVPNSEVLVLREDGMPCVSGEPGELVHRGALVAMGYWNDAEKTAQHFRPIKTSYGGSTITEIAAWSGDTVRMDDEGYLYFIERRDEMIKTSGYRVSPTEIEEVIYASDSIAEAVAIGVPHPVLGQAIVVIATARSGKRLIADELLKICKKRLPAFMLPSHIEIHADHLPRNPNGKIDRQFLLQQWQHMYQEHKQ